MSDALPAESPDPAIARAEQRLSLLRELAEIGMDLARALHREALAAEPAAPETPAADPAGAFARLSRAIRLTLALEARTDEALRSLRSGLAAERETRRVEASRRAAAEDAARRRARGEKVQDLVLEAAEREIEDEEALSDILAALEERLDADEAYLDLDALPLRQIVERLCADLQLTPDWSLWDGEAWAPNEPFFRSRGSVFRRPSRKPLLPPFDPAALQAARSRAHCLE
ncbi:MAG TPA: hypothetical protein VH353_14440 [Caulobacteraceae bacterium]|nr:hypothetical protein [Caulobacteraceae bacterium]